MCRPVGAQGCRSFDHNLPSATERVKGHNPLYFFSREKETEILKEQIDKLDTQINKEEEKAKDLEVKAR